MRRKKYGSEYEIDAVTNENEISLLGSPLGVPVRKWDRN